MRRPTVVELCAGAGGQSLGLERAGFNHVAAVEIDPDCCRTLRLNRPEWRVFEQDLRLFDGREFVGVDLLAGGLPCPPFSVAGQQLGEADERNLFPEGIRLVREIRPRAVMFENVRGMLDPRFAIYRDFIHASIEALGYRVGWRLLNACDYGVGQLRPRVIFLALRQDHPGALPWPPPNLEPAPTVGTLLLDLMAEQGWEGAAAWAQGAQSIAPTVVGGSKKHGGPDLGPSRARKAWAELGVDGLGIAAAAPPRGFEGKPKLTVRMVARVQGLPDDWQFAGTKTASYRQVGNAFPPPVAQAVAHGLKASLKRFPVVEALAS